MLVSRGLIFFYSYPSIYSPSSSCVWPGEHWAKSIIRFEGIGCGDNWQESQLCADLHTATLLENSLEILEKKSLMTWPCHHVKQDLWKFCAMQMCFLWMRLTASHTTMSAKYLRILSFQLLMTLIHFCVHRSMFSITRSLSLALDYPWNFQPEECQYFCKQN